MNSRVRAVNAARAGARLPQAGFRLGRWSCFRELSRARLLTVAGVRVLARRVRCVREAPGSMGREDGRARRAAVAEAAHGRMCHQGMV